LEKGADNKYKIYAHDDGVTAAAITFFSTNTFTDSSGWHWFGCSWDGTNEQMYVDDVSEMVSSTHLNTEQASLGSAWTLGAFGGGGSEANVQIADFIYAQEYIDISVEATRRNFIDAEGLATDWTTALAAVSSPLMAFHLDAGEAVANFADNADGTGELNVYNRRQRR
jgi:hypothetical protein